MAGIRIGVDIGGTDTKIGLVDRKQNLFAIKVIATDAVCSWEYVLEAVSYSIKVLLMQNNLTESDCIGIGMGIPGMLDRRNGIVRYSNNIGWSNVPVCSAMKSYFRVPVKIANDADCAALGEATAGAGRECESMVMVTLGTGVGGGVILNRKIFEGSCIGGSELGHMVIVDDGIRCTCGRCGCLEAYASASALKRMAKEAAGFDINPKLIFEEALAGNDILNSVVERYLHYLGTGIVNIANIFRPQAILIGGGISAQGENLTRPIQKRLDKECFGTDLGEIPKVRIAELGNQAGMIGAANLHSAG